MLEGHKEEFGALIDLIQYHIKFPIRSVVIKVRPGPIISIGKTSSKGSFFECYHRDVYPEAHAYFDDRLAPVITNVFNSFLQSQQELKSSKHTLFLRFNRSRDLIEIFTSSSMVLSSKIDTLVL
jgi:hypothetical protein